MGSNLGLAEWQCEHVTTDRSTPPNQSSVAVNACKSLCRREAEGEGAEAEAEAEAEVEAEVEVEVEVEVEAESVFESVVFMRLLELLQSDSNRPTPLSAPHKRVSG
jgi:hypothetical protein